MRDDWTSEDFISATIRNVDAMLAAERREDLRQAGIEQELADMRPRWNGMRDGEWCCGNCGAKESECRCEWTDATRADYEAWSTSVDAEFEHLCRVHGSELRENGLCAECEAELADERRNDA